MFDTRNDISLKPAKRVLMLYLLGILVTIGVFGLGIQYFGQRVGLETPVSMYVWIPCVLIGAGSLGYAVLWRFTFSHRLGTLLL